MRQKRYLMLILKQLFQTRLSTTLSALENFVTESQYRSLLHIRLGQIERSQTNPPLNYSFSERLGSTAMQFKTHGAR